MLKCMQDNCPEKYKDNGILNPLIHYAMATEHPSVNIFKALCFYGATGTGKTLHMRGLSKFLELPQVERNEIEFGVEFFHGGVLKPFTFKIYHMRRIFQDYADGGFEKIKNVMIEPVICIDDVGTEDVANNYGNKVDLFAHIVETRYDKDNVTHLTTNLNTQQLRERYGERVYSRLRETTQFINFGTEDRR
jgi:Cdc6-like AAA superfamily ATPase